MKLTLAAQAEPEPAGRVPDETLLEADPLTPVGIDLDAAVRRIARVGAAKAIEIGVRGILCTPGN